MRDIPSVKGPFYGGPNVSKFCLDIDGVQKCSADYDVSTPKKKQDFELRMSSLSASLAFSEVWRNKKCNAKKTFSAGFDLDKTVEHFEFNCGLSDNERTLVQSQAMHLSRMQATLKDLEECRARTSGSSKSSPAPATH